MLAAIRADGFMLSPHGRTLNARTLSGCRQDAKVGIAPGNYPEAETLGYLFEDSDVCGFAGQPISGA